MLATISFIFIFTIVTSLEAETITLGQAILWGMYGCLMFYHTSKSYWSENQEKNKKNRRK